MNTTNPLIFKDPYQALACFEQFAAAWDEDQISKMEFRLREKFPLAAFSADKNLETRFTEGVERAQRVSAQLRLEKLNLEILPEEAIDLAIKAIRRHFFVTKLDQTEVEVKLKQAAVEANKRSAFATLEKIEGLLDGALSQDAIAVLERRSRRQFLVGEVTIDAQLETRIAQAVVKAHKESAERRLSVLETTSKCYSLTDTNGQADSIRAQFKLGQVTVDLTLEDRIQAVAKRVHEQSARHALLRLEAAPNLPGPEAIFQQVNDIRLQFQAAGIKDDSGIEQRMQAVVARSTHSSKIEYDWNEVRSEVTMGVTKAALSGLCAVGAEAFLYKDHPVLGVASAVVALVVGASAWQHRNKARDLKSTMTPKP